MRNLSRKKGLVLSIATLLITVFLMATPLSFADTSTSLPSFTSQETAGQYFYDQMMRHAPQISFVYVTDQSNGSQIGKAFKNASFTDNANSPALLGDYVRYNLYNGYRLKYAYEKNNGKYHYTFHYEMSYRGTLAQEQKFETALTSTTNSLKLAGKSDAQKVKAIYDYICDTVKYDDQHNSTYYLKYTAYAALINQTSVCQGYSNLFYRMCKKSRIPVRMITGTSKGENHAWNIVKLGSKYYNVDATWDAGSAKYTYFLKSNKQFKNHTRNAEYTTSAFSRQHPMATTRSRTTK